MKQLLIEYESLEYTSSLLMEAADMSKPLVLRNVLLQRANTKNQNGRVYPKDVLFREVSAYKKGFVMDRRAMGELDHPERPTVNLKNVCCNITDIWINEDEVRGDIAILTTPAGNIVRELIKNNVRIGVSSRSMGSVKKMDESTTEVQDDLSLICFDIVSTPSVQGAYLTEAVNDGSDVVQSRLDILIYDFLSEIK